MHLGWNVWLTLMFHWFLTITANDSISTDLQGYEHLIPYSTLYQACIDQNLQSCDIFNYEDVEKRSPAFNAWGGKRAKFSSWGGKRDSMEDKRAKFNSWGGKRGSQFSSWGGKRDGNSLNEVNGRDRDFPEKLVKFSSWGGKRDIIEDKRAKFNSWGGKRAPKFSSWGGKRSPELFEGVKREKSFALKKPAFSNWGGKRSDEATFNEVEEYPWEQDEEHIVKKRDTNEEEFDGHMPDLWKEFFDRISNPNYNKNHPYDLVAVSTIKTPVKKSPADSHLQRLFKQFVYWTGNQPEEKKNTLMNSRMFKELNASPMRRGSPEFFNWGGKRGEVSSQ